MCRRRLPISSAQRTVGRLTAALALDDRRRRRPTSRHPRRRRAEELSAFGFFDDLRGADAGRGRRALPLTTPLFSDGAVKMRFVFVPARQAGDLRDADEAFDFPVGTALVKTFAFPADYRAPTRTCA